MKRFLALAATVTILAGLLSVGWTTAAAASDGAVKVIDFSGFTVGDVPGGPDDVKLTDPIDASAYGTLGWDDGSGKNIGSKFDAEIVSYEGGKALQWTNLADGNTNTLHLNLAPDHLGVTDWAGATDVLVWVDTTGSNNRTELELRVVEVDRDGDTAELQSWCSWKDGSGNTLTKYYIEQDGAWVACETTWGRAKLPMDYVGYVRMPLNQEELTLPWWDTTLKGSDNTLSLDELYAVGIRFQSKKNDVVIVDSVAVLGIEDPSKPTQDDTNPTTQPTETPTTTEPTPTKPVAAALNVGGQTAGLVLSFDKTPAGTAPGGAGDKLDNPLDKAAYGYYGWDDGSGKNIGTKFDAKIVASGLSGNALQWTNLVDKDTNTLHLNIGADSGITDWTGATDLLVWVDASKAAGQTEVEFRLVEVDHDAAGKAVALQSWCSWKESDGTTHTEYYYLKDGKWTKLETKWGRAKLPQGYKGWVRMPLDAEKLTLPWWETSLKGANQTLDLKDVYAVGIRIQGQKNDVVLVDSIAAYGIETAQGNGTSTTTPGAATGQTPLSALFVALVPAAAAVLLYTKKKHIR